MKLWASLIPAFIVMGCHEAGQSSQGDQLGSALEGVSKEFDIHNMSYLVSVDGKITDQNYSERAIHGRQSKGQSIINTFFDPIKLDLYIRDSSVNGDSSLNSYFNSVTNKYIKVKDLVIVPADNFEPDMFQQDSVCKMTYQIVRSVKYKTRDTAVIDFNEEFDDAGNSDTKSIFTKLSDLSKYFDKNYRQYASMRDSLVSNLFPTWYTENKSLFFGWKILKLQNQTILWNCFNEEDETFLVMKFMDKDIFVAVSYSSKTIPNPYDYNKEDPLQSPIALALIKSLLLPPTSRGFDFKRPWDSIAADMKPFENSPYRILQMKDLVAHARYFERSGDQSDAKMLYDGYRKITGDSLLVKYLNQPVVADMGYISNNLNATSQFTVQKDGYYQLFSGGQVLKVSDYNSAPYQYDNIQIYLNENIYTGQYKKDETQVFHFNYRFNKVAGMQDDRHSDNWLKNTKIRFAFSDPSDTSYILEVAIPWNEIHHNKKSKRNRFGINILIGDSDFEENKRESILSWSTKPGQGWDDPSTYGVLSFVPEIYPSGRQDYFSHRVKQPPVIDGLIDEIWEKVKLSPIDQPYYGKVTHFDNSGEFGSLYDDKYLYFLFYITDNCKNKTGIITKDKCWIEDASNGELRWKLPADTTKYLPSYSVEHKILLRAGKYYLRYLSDKGHSFEGWYGAPPQNDIYGGTIYKAIP